MNKFVNKAAVERKLNQESLIVEDEDNALLGKFGARRNDADAVVEGEEASLHNSGYWQKLDESHETEDSAMKTLHGQAANGKTNNAELNNSYGSAKQENFRFEIEDIDLI